MRFGKQDTRKLSGAVFSAVSASEKQTTRRGCGEREKVNIFTDKCLLLSSNHISRVVNDFSSPFALITDSLVIFINYGNACSSSSLFSLGIWVIFRIQRSKNSCVSIRNRSGDHINTASVNMKEQWGGWRVEGGGQERCDASDDFEIALSVCLCVCLTVRLSAFIPHQTKCEIPTVDPLTQPGQR